jgi:hypothetical protein
MVLYSRHIYAIQQKLHHDGTKIIGEGPTYDDVLLVPNFSNVLPTW